MNFSNFRKKIKLLYRAYRLKYRKPIVLRFQNIEDDLYEVNIKAEPFLQALSFFLVTAAFLTVLIPMGFRLSPQLNSWNENLEIGLLHGFIFFYLIRLVLTANRGEFIKRRWFEGVLTIFAFLIVVQLWFNNFNLAFPSLKFFGIQDPHDVVLDALKIYLILLVVIKAIQTLPAILNIQKNTGRLLVISFMGLILFGALLLMMPKMTLDQQGLSFVDALFTSTSAVCVTGLIVVDTATHFTMAGQVVIMILIQLGGIGIVTFATFFALFLSSGLGVGQMTFLRDILQESSVNEIIGTLYRIIGLTLFIELIGAVSFFISWSDMIPNVKERIFFSMFHSVSAFCNAGFALFTNGFADKANALNFGVNITTMLLIIFGGLGFTTIWEIVSDAKNRISRHHRLSVHSKLVVVTTLVLIVSGAAVMLASEWNGVLHGYSFGVKTMMAFFQSVTTRTAGFNTVNIGTLTSPAAIFMMILMFIGASPASTGGGVKTTTAAVLFMAVKSTIQGHKRIEVSKKTIPYDIVFEALTAFLLGAALIFISAEILSITEKARFMDLLFEEISAFATCGLSRGITMQLTNWGKIILVISMYIGRIGSVTLAVAFASKIDKRRYQYPTESVLVS
jgi:trk system potassium uptake protein TrkH